MTEYCWNVSHNGVHLFRTTEYDEHDAAKIRTHLITVFASQSGYEILEYTINTNSEFRTILLNR